MERYRQSQHAVWFRSPVGAITLVALILVAIYLLTEHTVHVLAFLPFGIILLCPLMHLFMHGGHGGHGDGSDTAQHTEGDEPHV